MKKKKLEFNAVLFNKYFHMAQAFINHSLLFKLNFIHI